MLTHSKIPKFGFIGTSSAGKTTATYQTCGFLKTHGIRVDGILQQDRRLPFDPALLPTHAEAQYWFITNMMTVECYLSLQKGVDCIVSDRSVVDFYAYAETQWPGQLHELRSMVKHWASTYTRLYYLPPREYDNDGVRPSDEFRRQVDSVLCALLPEFDSVKQVSSWEVAAREIAVMVKQQQLHPSARITGSWNSGSFKPESDFDFILTPAEWATVPPAVKDTFVENDPQPSRLKHNDIGLLHLYHSDALNIGVQVQDPEHLSARMEANLVESR